MLPSIRIQLSYAPVGLIENQYFYSKYPRTRRQWPKDNMKKTIVKKEKYLSSVGVPKENSAEVFNFGGVQITTGSI